MFKHVLFTQWKWAQWGLLVACALAVAMPMFAIASLGGRDVTILPIYNVVATMQGAGVGYGALSLLAGLWIAASAWSVDQQFDYVYALTRPVPRWYFVLLRFGAGSVLVGAVVVACLAGALAGSALVKLPATLHAYPGALTLRFGLALFVAFGGAFGLFGAASKTISRSTAIGLFVLIVVVAFDGLLLGGVLSKGVGRWLVSRWSPLGVYIGRWMLIDV